MTMIPSVTEKPTAMKMANCKLVALPCGVAGVAATGEGSGPAEMVTVDIVPCA